jgi:hypothetical protein
LSAFRSAEQILVVLLREAETSLKFSGKQLNKLGKMPIKAYPTVNMGFPQVKIGGFRSVRQELQESRI